MDLASRVRCAAGTKRSVYFSDVVDVKKVV